jgi:hypothetical protein
MKDKNPDKPKRLKRVFRQFNVDKDELKYSFSYNEGETEALRDHFKAIRQPTLGDLRRVALWKIDRVLEVPDETLKTLAELARATKPALDGPLARETLSALVDCPGIGFPMASAILKFLQPEVFPIIDVRAYRALTGKKPNHHTYTVDVYFDYARQIAAIAGKKGMSLSAVDEQLYEFDKKHNKTIGPGGGPEAG